MPRCIHCLCIISSTHLALKQGDGVTDDTAAINAAISAGSRCALGCDSSTVSPAVVYFPRGTYVVSAPIIALYYTVILGDARSPPTIVAASNFAGMAVIDAGKYCHFHQSYTDGLTRYPDPYIPDGWGAQYYTNQVRESTRILPVHVKLIHAF